MQKFKKFAQNASEKIQKKIEKEDENNSLNWLETVFWYIKTRLRCHSWLRLNSKLKFIKFLISQLFFIIRSNFSNFAPKQPLSSLSQHLPIALFLS